MENGGTNGGLKEHLPWSWDTQTVDIYRYFATLHSELASYVFSYSVEAHLTGTSILRATDKAAAQHLLGDQLFASVITTDVTSKTVKLPPGDKWIDYWNEDTTYAAGTTMTYAAPLDRYPLFIRAGAVIPLTSRRPSPGTATRPQRGRSRCSSTRPVPAASSSTARPARGPLTPTSPSRSTPPPERSR